jgi:hypothetical protein
MTTPDFNDLTLPDWMVKVWSLNAATEAVGVTDEELDALEKEHWESTGVVSEALQLEELFNYRAFARAVLARYGTHPAPGPVSERPILKSSNFNDAQGHCWCGTKASVDESGDLPVNYPMAWELREPCAQDDCVMPHWALPLPEAQP